MFNVKNLLQSLNLLKQGDVQSWTYYNYIYVETDQKPEDGLLIRGP